MTSNECFTISDMDKDVIIAETKDKYFINSVNPDDYYIATDNTPIIGTYGLNSSLCIVLRDPVSTKTMLAHINEVEDFLDFFLMFDSFKKVDVYMMGGNNLSIDMCTVLLSYFEKRTNYTIKFAHIIDPYENSFGIDSRNGTVYMNPDVDSFVKY